MSSNTGSDLSMLLNKFEDSPQSKLDELDRKLEKVTTCIKNLQAAHTRIESTFDRVEEKLHKIPGQFNGVHKYIILIDQQITQLNKKKNKPKKYDDKFFIGLISILLSLLMIILYSFSPTGILPYK